MGREPKVLGVTQYQDRGLELVSLLRMMDIRESSLVDLNQELKRLAIQRRGKTICQWTLLFLLEVAQFLKQGGKMLQLINFKLLSVSKMRESAPRQEEFRQKNLSRKWTRAIQASQANRRGYLMVLIRTIFLASCSCKAHNQLVEYERIRGLVPVIYLIKFKWILGISKKQKLTCIQIWCRQG